MPTDQREPWSDRTYNGFSGPAATAAPPPRRGLPRVSGRALAVGGAGAIALGLVLGVWARPNLGKDPTAAAERNAPPVPIEVNRLPPQPVPTAAGKLEVLSPDQAAQARAATASTYAPPMPAGTSSYVPGPPPPLPGVERPAYAPNPAYRQAPPPSPALQQAPAAPVPQVAIRQPPLPAQAQVPDPRQSTSRAGFDCAAARSPAEAMVCGDPELAAADREMTRAYRRALQSGSAQPESLRQEQRDFLGIREDAARHSRRALAQAYQQRIEELNDLADHGPEN